ncbi:MAG: hypothetical protein LBE86_00480, partial [Gemmobacter sp.]|nr:hypothetical protein [Gemmobacter sp.]
YHEGPICGHITGVGSDSHDMAERLGQIRAARNTGTDVTLTLTRSEALLAGRPSRRPATGFRMRRRRSTSSAT